MPVHNTEIADIFKQMADLLEIEGANQYRVRAYRDAAQTINSLSRRVTDMIEDEDEALSNLPGIGDDLAGKIEEIAKTGSLKQFEEIRQRIPPELANLLHISGLGPKRVEALHEALDVTTLEDLEEAARQEKIQEVEGFGQKTEQQLLEEVQKNRDQEERRLLMVVQQMAEPLLAYMRQAEAVQAVEIAGSYRRKKETIGDLDIVAASSDGEAVVDHFVAYEDVDEVVSKGETRSTILLRSGLQVDLRVVAQESYGAALLYLTGSKAHNIALRNIALDEDLKINEYGVFDEDKQLAGRTEEEMYNTFDLPYIVPELRENRGEIEAARAGRLPQLIEVADIKGDLHAHTEASDGQGNLEELAEAAKERGYEYLAITDHSKRVTVAQGLDAGRLAEQIEAIEQLNEKLEDIVLLKSAEVDILEDGTLDLPDDILQKLDLVVCSVHSKFGLSEKKQTERIIRAMDNPYFNILAHPTGRRLGERRPYGLDLEQVVEAAAERGCFLELNAQPVRLDLNDVYCQLAREYGVKIAISTDTHHLNDLDHIRFGVGQARRGWLTADDVLNTHSLKVLKELLQRS